MARMPIKKGLKKVKSNNGNALSRVKGNGKSQRARKKQEKQMRVKEFEEEKKELMAKTDQAMDGTETKAEIAHITDQNFVSKISTHSKKLQFDRKQKKKLKAQKNLNKRVKLVVKASQVKKSEPKQTEAPKPKTKKLTMAEKRAKRRNKTINKDVEMA